MADQAVFLCQVGELTRQSKKDLRAAGIVVAEVANIHNAQFIRAAEVIGANDMLWAVLDALNLQGSYGSDGTKQREQLAKNLLGVVLKAKGFEEAKMKQQAGESR